MKLSPLFFVLTASFALAGCAGTLDRRSPFGAPDFVNNVSAIEQRIADADTGHGNFSAGWSRVAIRPPPGVPLAGYGDRDGVPSEGEKDPAYVRAFAVAAGDHRIILFTADILLSDPNLVDGVRERLANRIDGKALFFTASHTHSGPGAFVPGLLWELVMGDFDQAALEAVVDAHVVAAEKALADLQPARIGAAQIPVPGLIKNRVEREGPTDDLLFLLRFEQKTKIAALWSFACHAVTLPAENLHVSADYPGQVAQAFEGRSLDLLGFAAGGVGSSNPRYEPDEKETTDWITSPLTRAVEQGLALAKQRSRNAGSLASTQVDLPTPRFRYRVAKTSMVPDLAVRMLVGIPRINFGAIAINDILLAHLPAEISGTLTRNTRRKAWRRGESLALLPFNGTYLGYIVPRRVYDLPAEQGEELLHYETHVLAFLGPYGGDILMNLGMRMALGVQHRTF